MAEVALVIVRVKEPSFFALSNAKPLRTFAGNALKAELVVRQTMFSVRSGAALDHLVHCESDG
ncbi:hypothetical protein CQZ93_11360 [Ochrobactrum vermis]|nr:hypothetical protein CQZ93_11360 [Ochrobactrum vermis]